MENSFDELKQQNGDRKKESVNLKKNQYQVFNLWLNKILNLKISLSKSQKIVFLQNIPLATENLKQKLRTLWERLLQEDGTERHQDVEGTITQYVGQMERVSVPIRGEFGAELMVNT